MESNSSSMTAGKELELEESFSFSCHELNSALQSLYYQCPSSSDDDESCFEIDLDSAPQSTDFDLLRISFESPPQIPAVHLPGPLSEPEMGICCDVELASPVVEISCCEDDAAAIGAVQEGVKVLGAVNDYSRKSRQFVRRLRNDDLFACRMSRAPSKIATRVNNGMMKFFIKLRSGTLLSSVVSLFKSYYTVSLRPSNRRHSHGHGHDDTQSSQDASQRFITKPSFCSWWAQMNNTRIIVDANVNRNHDQDRKKSRNNKKRAVVYRENSLHAAIAYCKRATADVVDQLH
ncbi:hypothetical protein ACLOJK_012311 [Asimina triloba]